MDIATKQMDITNEQMFCLIFKRPDGDLLVEKLAPYRFAVRDENDGGRAQYIINYFPDYFFDEQQNLKGFVSQTIEECLYVNGSHKLERIEDFGKIQEAMQKIAARLQEKDAELLALKEDVGVTLKTKANHSSASKSQLQNQDAVLAGLVEDGVEPQKLLQEIVAASHKKHFESCSGHGNSGATSSYIIFDPKTEVVDVANLGDGVALAFGELANGDLAVVRLAKSMAGDERKFRIKIIADAIENGYEIETSGGNTIFVKDGKREFVLTRDRIKECASRKEISLAMLGVVGDYDFSGIIIREPDLQSFRASDIAGFKMQFLMAASDGADAFLAKAKSLYHVFERNEDDSGFVLVDEGVNKKHFQQEWRQVEDIFEKMDSFLGGEDDLGAAILQVESGGKNRILLAAFDGHGLHGGHVAYLCAKNVREAAHIKIPQRKVDEVLETDLQNMEAYFLQNAIAELYLIKDKKFADLDLTALDAIKTKTAADFLPELKGPKMQVVLEKRKEVQKKIYDECLNMTRQINEMSGGDESGFLRKKGGDKISFFEFKDSIIDIGLNGCSNAQSRSFSFSQQVEIFENIKLRFGEFKSKFVEAKSKATEAALKQHCEVVESVLKRHSAIFRKQEFSGAFDLFVSNIILDDKAIAIAKNKRSGLCRFAQIEEYKDGKIALFSYAPEKELTQLVSMFEKTSGFVSQFAAEKMNNGASHGQSGFVYISSV